MLNFDSAFVIFNHNKLIYTMRENIQTTCLGLKIYTCYDGDIDTDTLDRAIDRLADSGTWVNG